MRAAVCPRYGGPEVVEMHDLPAPDPVRGQVLIRVEAAAVNFPDVLIMADRYQLKVPPPFIPGSEYAGVVTRVVDDDGPFEVGQRVFGTAMSGAFAEQIAAPVASLSAVPSGIGPRQAAAFGVAHRTAYHVLRSVAALGADEDLVVLGAGGGVGLAAVALGHHMGARVTAVASSPEKLEVAASEGARHLVDHRAADVRAALKEMLPGGADVVVDPVGGALSEPALRSLRWGGRFVTVGYASGEIPRIPLNLVLLKGVHVLGFEFRAFATHCPAEVARNEGELMGLLAGGRIVPHIGATFPLEEAAAALRHVAEGRAVGKVVLDVGSSQ